MSPALVSLVHALLEKDPRNRPANAAEVGQALWRHFPPHVPPALPAPPRIEAHAPRDAGVLDDVDPVAPG